jgi:hypothetical protein
MTQDEFVRIVTEYMQLAPVERHAQMADLHHQIYQEYHAALQRLSLLEAAQPPQINGEKRSLAQVVGHIIAWERFALQSVGEILSGVRHPLMITSVDGFVDEDGSMLRFTGIDDFNATFSLRHASQKWERIRQEALDTAEMLYVCFTHPRLLNAERLERTRPHRRRMMDRSVIEALPMGWSLWITVLEHEGVEHAAELRMWNAI